MMYFDKKEQLKRAEAALTAASVSITDEVCPLSKGTPHDYYSNGDYWWPNPKKADGLPYIRRDGESNPNAFLVHRSLMEYMKNHVCDLATGFLLTGEKKYAEAAERMLTCFFLDEETKMNPSLCFAQAIPGVCSGRGIGVIDTIHIMDIPFAIRVLQSALDTTVYRGLVQWFSDYLHWLQSHEYGMTERNEPNNHGACWYAQAAVFAWFTGDREMLDTCRNAFCEKLIPEQMAENGSFPLELGRTKPYNYSLFVVDIFSSLCQVLSDESCNLWEFSLPDGRGMKRAISFFYPYIENKDLWCYGRDIEHFDAFPVKTSFLLFAGLAYQHKGLLGLWRDLPSARESSVPEARRNSAVKHPILWIESLR